MVRTCGKLLDCTKRWWRGRKKNALASSARRSLDVRRRSRTGADAPSLPEQVRRPARKKLEQLTLELKKAARLAELPVAGARTVACEERTDTEVEEQSGVENCRISQNLKVTNQGRWTSARAISPLDEVDSIGVKLLM